MSGTRSRKGRTKSGRGRGRDGTSPTREAALRVLLSTDRGRRLDLAFDFESRELSATDRPWVQEATYGVLRHRGRIDAVIDAKLHAGPKSVSPGLRILLRLGVYQRLWMDSVPAHAAVNETVEMARSHFGPGAARLTNAVLRGVAPEDLSALELALRADGPGAFLSTWGSHPRWLIDRWLERWDEATVEAIVEANHRIPRLFVRSMRMNAREAVQTLSEVGVEALEHSEVGDLIELGIRSDVVPALDAVDGFVQDPGAAWVTEYAGVEKGTRVVDLCAAPGGKALAMARTADYVVAIDRSPARLVLLRDNVRRTRAAIGPVLARAEDSPVREADLVLVDAPCSGTGTFARHPDAKWRLSAETVERLVAVQARMLDAAAEIVPVEGVLVYSTCTLEEEENGIQAKRFLDRHPEFRLAPVSTSADRHVDAEGYLRVSPDRSGSDGAFAARFRRIG